MRDDPRGAGRLIREAVEMVPEDLVGLRADLYRDLASTLADRGTDAETAAATAMALYEKKGNLSGLAEVIS